MWIGARGGIAAQDAVIVQTWGAARLRARRCCARTNSVANRLEMGEGEFNPAIWEAIAGTGSAAGAFDVG